MKVSGKWLFSQFLLWICFIISHSPISCSCYCLSISSRSECEDRGQAAGAAQGSDAGPGLPGWKQQSHSKYQLEFGPRHVLKPSLTRHYTHAQIHPQLILYYLVQHSQGDFPIQLIYSHQQTAEHCPLDHKTQANTCAFQVNLAPKWPRSFLMLRSVQ